MAASLAICALLVLGAATAGAVTDAQVRACVLNNLIRYAPPDRAVVAQYLDLEAACRAQLEGAAFC